MDDFTVYGNAFDSCLASLDLVLNRCQEKHLVLNFDSRVNNAAWPPPPPPKRRPTCWDLPSRTHGRRVEEIRAPPLPEPPPQYTPTPSQHPALVQSRRSTYWDFPGQRQSRGIPTHDQPYGVPPYEQPRSPPEVYTSRQRDCQQPQKRNQHFTFPSSHTPTQPQLVLDQKPPPAAAAPPHTAPRPCQPLLPLSVKDPISASTRQLQGDVSNSRKKELYTDYHDSEEKREEKMIVLNNVGNQKEIEKENDSNAK